MSAERAYMYVHLPHVYMADDLSTTGAPDATTKVPPPPRPRGVAAAVPAMCYMLNTPTIVNPTPSHICEASIQALCDPLRQLNSQMWAETDTSFG